MVFFSLNTAAKIAELGRDECGPKFDPNVPDDIENSLKLNHSFYGLKYRTVKSVGDCNIEEKVNGSDYLLSTARED